MALRGGGRRYFALTHTPSKQQIITLMGVLLLTVFLSLLLVALFLVLFIGERRRKRFRSSEQDALLPFGDEDPRSDP